MAAGEGGPKDRRGAGIGSDVHKAAPEAPEPSVRPAVAPRRRGFSHIQTLGFLFGFLGVVLVARVVSALSDDDIAFVLGLGEAAPKLVLDPANAVLGIGVLLIIVGLVALADRWTKRYATVALLFGAILFVPLVLICALALSSSSQTNLLPLVVESLRLGTPIA